MACANGVNVHCGTQQLWQQPHAGARRGVNTIDSTISINSSGIELLVGDVRIIGAIL